MIWSARLYEVCRKEYLSRPFDEEVFPERPPNDEIKYRILENFDEGRLDTVTYATRATGSEFISSGDIESLVDALIFPLNQDNSYTEVFLASYRFFMPASELLTSLIEWYNVELDPATATPQQEQYFKLKKRQFRGRAAKVLLTWIKNHWHDFHVDKDLLDELSEFVGDLGEVCFGDGQRMTQAIREQRLSWYMTQYIPPFSAKRAPAAESAKPWGLLWEPEAFAAQLTLIDHHYFRQIRPDTYLSLLQKRVPKGTLAGDAAVKVLMDYVSWFRLVSSYTATLIYKEDTTKKRTKAIKRFIKVAKECRLLNNFNTMFAVMHGLKRNLVARMSGAWDGLSGKHVEAFREMEALMDPKGGFANFWGELKNCVAPLIPFFAAYIHDLLEIHETEPVFTRDLNKTQEQQQSGYRMVTTDDDDDNDPEIINFSKFYNLYSIVAEIEVWRSYSYNSVIPEAAAAANDPKGDTCAVVLNHMRDWKVVEDSLLDL
ncbi:ras guanine nucleotide exchange factor domain-containing protein [Obelidium mucronatum]|nr:ras guanine nucleotide exchange factor domain-containing protein [Obelidium mucronatum]